MAGNVQAAESESRGRAYGPALDEHDLVAQFEGLGDNVEFGCVQRTCGAEPLGLFRFSFSCKIAPLCHAFETGLEHLFTGEDLDVILDCGDGRFYCRSRYYDDFFISSTRRWER